MILDNFTSQEIRKAIMTDYQQLMPKLDRIQHSVVRHVTKYKIKTYGKVFDLYSKSRNHYKFGVISEEYGGIILQSFSLFYRFYNRPRLICLFEVDSDSSPTITIFTYHFIKRYNERLGLNLNSDRISNHIILNSYDLMLDHIGSHTYFGYSNQGYTISRKEEDENLMIFKTFLNPEILNNKQRAFYLKLKEGFEKEKEKVYSHINLVKSIFKLRTLQY